MSRWSGLRLVCEGCGSHHTRNVTVGQGCPLCGRGRLVPVDRIQPRPRADQPPTRAGGVPGTSTEDDDAPSDSST